MYYIKLAFVLLVIAGLAAGVLAFLNGKTAPIIAANKKQAEEQARAVVLPGTSHYVLDSLAVETAPSTDSLEPLRADTGDGSGMFYFYRCYDNAEDMNFIGYIFTAFGKGYSSTIQTMCGVTAAADGTLELNAIKILYQQETPGLGANAEQPKFLREFNGALNADTDTYEGREPRLTAPELFVDKDGGNIISITGATISSRAIINSIREGMKQLPAIPVANEAPTVEETEEPQAAPETEEAA